MKTFLLAERGRGLKSVLVKINYALHKMPLRKRVFILDVLYLNKLFVAIYLIFTSTKRLQVICFLGQSSIHKYFILIFNLLSKPRSICTSFPYFTLNSEICCTIGKDKLSPVGILRNKMLSKYEPHHFIAFNRRCIKIYLLTIGKEVLV